MKPFLFGKKIHPFESLRAAGTSALPPVSAAPSPVAHPSTSAPTIETIKEGDKVVRMIITCSCGERIEVECMYPTGK
jgi:hypothetical protein